MLHSFRKTAAASAAFISFISLFSGCSVFSENGNNKVTCHVVIEDTEGITVDDPAATVSYGGSAEFTAHLEDGYTLDNIDYDNVSIEDDGQDVTITINDIRYSETISLEVSSYPLTFNCDANFPVDITGDTEAEVNAEVNTKVNAEGDTSPAAIRRKDSHLRINTPSAAEVDFSCDGYTLTGWNTNADGSGIAVGLGSRISMGDEEEITLYAQWTKWTDSSCFTWNKAGTNAVITGYNGAGNSTPETIAVPEEIDGYPVISIAENAVKDANCRTLILPENLLTIKDGGIGLSNMETLYLYDSLSNFSDRSFEGCDQLKTLHINAAKEPVYSKNYFGTFADKYDWLCSIEEQQKIVLFSGSSARFGYDSTMLKEAFGDYEVANMGVFAYTNGYPQALLILNHMKEGDIFLDSPEFDAAKRQFFTTNELDDSFFCMMEANYDMITELDLRECAKVFSSFHTYLSDKKGMEAQSYDLSPSDYDEDGNRVNEKSYNGYGDYILYRPNADTDEPVYGLEVKYTVDAYPYDSYIAPANEMFTRFLQKGVHVYWTYAPRNSLALSTDSTEAAREKLHEYLKENLCVPVISDIEESLYPGKYLYGTDNHLSTEGVEIRTEKIIEELKVQLESEVSGDNEKSDSMKQQREEEP